LFQQVCYGGDRQLKPCPVVPAPVHERKMAVNQVTGKFQNRLLGGKLDHGLNASVQNSLAVLLITRITQPKRIGRNLPHDDSPFAKVYLLMLYPGLQWLASQGAVMNFGSQSSWCWNTRPGVSCQTDDDHPCGCIRCWKPMPGYSRDHYHGIDGMPTSVLATRRFK